MNSIKNILPVFLFIATGFFLQTAAGCKKEKSRLTPVPFLTGRIWMSDTILVTPPKTYAQLTPGGQQDYNRALAWFHNASIRFNEDGTVVSGGDYDFGYKTWRLVNNNQDIEATTNYGPVQFLRNWVANTVQLTYVLSSNSTFDMTLVFK